MFFEVSKQVETGREKIENRLTESLRSFVYVCLRDVFVSFLLIANEQHFDNATWFDADMEL